MAVLAVDEGPPGTTLVWADAVLAAGGNSPGSGILCGVERSSLLSVSEDGSGSSSLVEKKWDRRWVGGGLLLEDGASRMQNRDS